MLAYLDCFSGISGDMVLGALVDAGLDLERLRAGLAALALSGYTLEAEQTTDAGIRGTRVRVRIDASTQTSRHLSDIEALIVAADLPEPVQQRALAVFRRLGASEARIHGTPVEEVHFHEVGAVDSIVDTVGAVLGLHLLGVDEVYCSELPLTSGRVRSAHGALPVPAPATLDVLAGTDAVWRPVPTEGELVTPTGAAILATLATFTRPTLRVHTVGYGFGQKQLPWANCLRLVLGEHPASASIPTGETEGFERDEIVVIESNIDNMTGESLGWLMERLLDAGALDVTFTPLQMKKQRPATLLTVLATPERAATLAQLVVRESSTLGVRMTRAERVKAGREHAEIETPLGRVRVKLKRIDGALVAVTPEDDDCRALAAQHSLPVEVVRARLTAAAMAALGVE